jgi:hypothetical protein
VQTRIIFRNIGGKDRAGTKVFPHRFGRIDTGDIVGIHPFASDSFPEHHRQAAVGNVGQTAETDLRRVGPQGRPHAREDRDLYRERRRQEFDFRRQGIDRVDQQVGFPDVEPQKFRYRLGIDKSIGNVDLRRGPDVENATARGFGLSLADRRMRGQELTPNVASGDPVAVDEEEAPDPSTGERLEGVSPDRTDSGDHHERAVKPFDGLFPQKLTYPMKLAELLHGNS